MCPHFPFKHGNSLPLSCGYETLGCSYNSLYLHFTWRSYPEQFTGGLSALSKCTSTDFSFSRLRDSNQQPFVYWPNKLTAKLPTDFMSMHDHLKCLIFRALWPSTGTEYHRDVGYTTWEEVLAWSNVGLRKMNNQSDVGLSEYNSGSLEGHTR